MAVKIRLARRGRKKLAIYDVVVADARSPRDGRYIEKLGTFNPNFNPYLLEIDTDKTVEWLLKGAKPTDTARNLLSAQGIMLRKHLQVGVLKGALSQDEADKKFEAWLKDKEQKNIAQADKIRNKLDLERKARLEAESKVKEAKAAELRKKQEAAAVEDQAEAIGEGEVSPEQSADDQVQVSEAVQTQKDTVTDGKGIEVEEKVSDTSDDLAMKTEATEAEDQKEAVETEAGEVLKTTGKDPAETPEKPVEMTEEPTQLEAEKPAKVEDQEMKKEEKAEASTEKSESVDGSEKAKPDEPKPVATDDKDQPVAEVVAQEDQSESTTDEAKDSAEASTEKSESVDGPEKAKPDEPKPVATDDKDQPVAEVVAQEDQSESTTDEAKDSAEATTDETKPSAESSEVTDVATGDKKEKKG